MNPALEISIRVAAYAAVFLALAAWEVFAPRRVLGVGRMPRWPSNLGILLVDAAILRLLIPVAAVGAAVIAADRGWGLFHALELPFWAQSVLGFVLLDLVIYLQHFAFHRITPLWRLHRMHHADLDIDVTTGVRFHPLEIVISMLIKIAVVTGLGIPPLAVLVFEIALNTTSMFNHANVALPAPFDRLLRWIVVTPDMHRVHHSVDRVETDSNFGFNLPWWDWLFGTYRAGPAAGHLQMTVGLPIFRAREELRLVRMLTQPFREPQDTPQDRPAFPLDERAGNDRDGH